jgi:hypothetical protein
MRAWIIAFKGAAVGFLLYQLVIIAWLSATLEPFWHNTRVYTILAVVWIGLVGGITRLCMSIHKDNKQIKKDNE